MITKTDLDEVERLCNQVLADIKLVRADRKVNDELEVRRKNGESYWYVAHLGDVQNGRAVQELNVMYDEIDRLRNLAAAARAHQAALVRGTPYQWVKVRDPEGENSDADGSFDRQPKHEVDLHNAVKALDVP